jgi:hypothetical protein
VQRALVKILKGALKEKGKGIPLSTAALPLLNFYFYSFFFWFPSSLLLVFSLYRRDGKKEKKMQVVFYR